MKKDKKIAHTENELTTIFKKQNIKESLFPFFLARYKIYFDELYQYMKDYEEDDFEEGDSIHDSALYVLDLYIKPFIKIIENGHSEKWAHLVSKNIEDNEWRIYEAFNELKKEQPKLAQQELELHCNNLSKDEDFRRHYLFLFSIGEGMDKPYEKATEYAEDYKEQIKKGKSKLFAHEYADLGNSDYHDIYREEYAYAYEKAILNKKSERYARVFADTYASELVDIKRRAGISDDEELIDFTIEKVNGFMKAWEYISENKIKNSDRFYSIYENKHLNTYFADDGMPEGTMEEIDKGILEKVLLEYNKL